MNILHHANEETLARYAAGVLGAGPAMVVGAHIEACAECRARLTQFESLGGALLEAELPTSLSPSAMADTLARIDGEAAPLPAASSPAHVERDGLRLPSTLAGSRMGRWRWIAPGMRMSRVRTPRAPDANLILLKIEPGGKLPLHGHGGAEFTYVVSGSFTDKFGRFGPGDMTEHDSDVEHEPTVDPDGPCICLAALDGRMRFKGLAAQMLQPLFGI